MQWKGKFYVDKTLQSFGLHSDSMQSFHCTGDALKWILQAGGVDWCIHFIDNFLKAGALESDECEIGLRINYYQGHMHMAESPTEGGES